MADDPNKKKTDVAPVVETDAETDATPIVEDSKPGTSADVATSRSAKVARKLEERISSLETALQNVTGENKLLKEKVELATKLPAPGQPGKSLWQYLDEMCFVKKEGK